MEDVPSRRRNDFLSLLSILGHLQRSPGRNDSSLLPAPEADAVSTDYREKFEQGVTHSPEESGNESGNMYRCERELRGDIGKLEQWPYRFSGSVGIMLQQCNIRNSGPASSRLDYFLKEQINVMEAG